MESAGELAESQGYARRHGQGGEPSTEPDVLLDVPQLRVEEIILDVEELRAHVSVEAEVLNLLRLSVGADVQLGGVHLEIRGVEAQVLLKARLDKVAEIINRVLTTVDRNPEIVDQVVPTLAAAAGDLERAAGGSVDQLGGAVETAAADLHRSVQPPETAGDAGESGAAEEQAVAEGPEHEAESAGSEERTSRGLRRRRKHERKAEELPP